MKALTVAILCVVMYADDSLAQTTFSQRECYCLDNATTAINGQYRDSITITGIPGQTWRLMNPIGFYNPLSLAPPAAPVLYLNNTIIPETAPGSGIYRIVGKRISGQSWSTVVTNGSTVQALSSSQSCSYPAPPATAIVGDAIVCQSCTASYAIPASANLSNIVWSVPAGGSLASGQGTNAITVTWNTVPGNYNVEVSAELVSYPTQPNACEFTSTRVVSIVDPARLTAIRGDFGNCIGDTETYTIGATPAQVSGVSWGVFLDAAGTMPSGILSAASVNSQTITWPNTTGVYYLRVTGNFVAGNNLCPFTTIERIDIVNEVTVPLACNNLVAQVQKEAAKHGLFWAPDPTSSAYSCVGGNLGCNAAGPRGVKYGTTRENVLGLTFVTGEGKTIHSGVCTTKGVVGYDLARLMIGSEGTLGIITQATLKLSPIPEKIATMRALFSSNQSAAKAVASIMGQAVTPCAVQFADEHCMKIIKSSYPGWLPDAAKAMLMLEVD